MPTKGNATAGSVSFKQVGSKVLVTAEVKGLKPNAEHGFISTKKVIVPAVTG